MKLTPFSIERIAPFIVAKSTGKEIIRFLADYGIRVEKPPTLTPSIQRAMTP